MNNLIKKLSPTAELLIVMILGFGFFIYGSNRSFFVVNSDYTHSWIYKLTSQGHFSLVIHETIALLIIIYILKVRDWSISDFNLTFTVRLIWIGLLIMFIRNIIGNVGLKIFEAIGLVDDSILNHVQYGSEANWISMALIVVVNSIFEEVLLLGYLFKRLEKYHPAFIIGLSLLIRQSYHTYQGWMSLVAIIPTGLVFGYYYYKHKKLWPVIIAHGFSNLIVFLNMHFHWYEKFQQWKG